MLLSGDSLPCFFFNGVKLLYWSVRGKKEDLSQHEASHLDGRLCKTYCVNAKWTIFVERCNFGLAAEASAHILTM